jgi:hypothetical protein
MIVLKKLAQQYQLDPYKLRQMLRKEFGKSDVPGRYVKWRWEEGDPMLTKVRNFLDSIATKPKLRKMPVAHAYASHRVH